MANALSKLGVEKGDRVGALAWNTHRHLELYLAVPCYGAVLNTLNLRLFHEQIAYIVNHAGDEILFVDDDLLPILEEIKDELTNVRHFIVMSDAEELPATCLAPVHSYEELLGNSKESCPFPDDIDEWLPAAMCYTTATTGHPKGVVYTHRAIYLHSLALGLVDTMGIGEHDVVMPAVPMFHVNAWGIPFAATWFGAKQVFPREKLDGRSLCELIEREAVTITGGVPTLLKNIYEHLEAGNRYNLTSLRKLLGGGSAAPRALIEAFREKYGIAFANSYGMTETSPVVVTCNLKSHMDDWPKERILDVLVRQGTLMPGLEMEIIDETGTPVERDGKQVGEIRLRGPWVAADYYRDFARTAEAVRDGWLHTGDIASMDQEGYVQIVDRTKDMIKSGGEWISSIDLETTLMAHPGVLEAAVIGVPHEKWHERPLALVAPRQEVRSRLTEKEILDFLRGRVAKWWLPDKILFIEEIPKTSVGKFDKKKLRQTYGEQLPHQQAGPF